ncbi:MAG: LytTR family DNA-binding domain-containing protein [Bacteroidota bacterium]
MENIKAILIDDESKSRSNLRQLLLENCRNIDVVAEAGSAIEAIRIIGELSPDLLFLDIEMGDISGFDMLKLLTGKKNFQVIFVTAFDQYRLQIAKACAIDYLLKPINTLELSNVVKKATVQNNPKRENKRLKELISNLDKPNDEQNIAIILFDEIEFVSVSKIIRLEADVNYTHIYLDTNKQYQVYKTLKEYQDMLENHNFIRTHQSHIINFNKINYLKSNNEYIVMDDNSRVPISRQKKDEVLLKIRNGKS